MASTILLLVLGWCVSAIPFMKSRQADRERHLLPGDVEENQTAQPETRANKVNSPILVKRLLLGEQVPQ